MTAQARPKTFQPGAMSEDEFDQLPDPFEGIDWDTVPGLGTIPPASQPSASTLGGIPAPGEPRLLVPLANGQGSSLAPTQHPLNDWDNLWSDEMEVVLLLAEEEERLSNKWYNPDGQGLGPWEVDRSLLLFEVEGGSQPMEPRGEGASNGEFLSMISTAPLSMVVQGISSPYSAYHHPPEKSPPPPTREGSPDPPRGIRKELEFLSNIKDDMICLM